MKSKQILLTGLFGTIAITACPSKGMAALFYSVDVQTDSLVTVDSTTGNVNVLGDTGINENDIDLTWFNHRLYGVGAARTLYEFDILTGAASRVADVDNVRLSEGLAYQNGQLMLGYNQEGNVFSNKLGELSSTYTLGSILTGGFSDIDGLATSPTDRLYAVDYISAQQENVFFVPGETPPIGKYKGAGLNDLSFAGDELFGISSNPNSSIPSTMARLDSTNGGLIEEIVLNQAGVYRGLAPAQATSVPEPSLTLGILAFAGLSASLGSRRAKLH